MEDKSTESQKYDIIHPVIQNVEANVYTPKTLAKNIYKMMVIII